MITESFDAIVVGAGQAGPAIAARCSRQGLQLSPVLVSNHARTVIQFVLNGGGLSVSSEIAARHRVADGAIVARPISDPGMDLRDIEVQTLAGRHLPVAVEAFLALLRERLPAPA